ncbi:protein MAINTENANCE OF MERISTEMS-like [Lathyrus oleraceus]|uniref:protein MAINTENANCE OF MERISTEMS-like n=1 Tax=Pisum sativum TaxID=3888 RepID=UPI0021CE8FD3|nr:protein MAINTENANCE OF MERISTEMS-like [Pisum sativum]
MFSCKQLAGYPTLLQCWIHKYFPTVGKRGENWKPADNCGLPRAMRWSYRQGVLKVDDLRSILDELTPADVIWRPFEDHRALRQFGELCLYRGCLKWGDTVVPYLPNRCLRQFGYKQYDAGPSDPDWARVSTLIHRYLRQVNTEEEDPQFVDLFEAMHISRSH